LIRRLFKNAAVSMDTAVSWQGHRTAAWRNRVWCRVHDPPSITNREDSFSHSSGSVIKSRELVVGSVKRALSMPRSSSPWRGDLTVRPWLLFDAVDGPIEGNVAATAWRHQPAVWPTSESVPESLVERNGCVSILSHPSILWLNSAMSEN
jgi:hypothetical protein